MTLVVVVASKESVRSTVEFHTFAHLLACKIVEDRIALWDRGICIEQCWKSPPVYRTLVRGNDLGRQFLRWYFWTAHVT